MLFDLFSRKSATEATKGTGFTWFHGFSCVVRHSNLNAFCVISLRRQEDDVWKGHILRCENVTFTSFTWEFLQKSRMKNLNFHVYKSLGSEGQASAREDRGEGLLRLCTEEIHLRERTDCRCALCANCAQLTQLTQLLLFFTVRFLEQNQILGKWEIVAADAAKIWSISDYFCRRDRRVQREKVQMHQQFCRRLMDGRWWKRFHGFCKLEAAVYKYPRRNDRHAPQCPQCSHSMYPHYPHSIFGLCITITWLEFARYLIFRLLLKSGETGTQWWNLLDFLTPLHFAQTDRFQSRGIIHITGSYAGFVW